MLASQTAPFLRDGQAVLLAPGYGSSILFRRALLQLGRWDVLVGKITNFSHACRIIAPGKVVLKAEKAVIDGAAVPATATGLWLTLVRDAYPQLAPARTVLEVALNNPNPIAHPIACLLKACHFERPSKDQPLIEEWETPRVRRLIDELDWERLRVLDAAGLVLFEAVGKLCGIEVPVTTQTIDLANLLYDQDVRQQGYTLQRLGFGGP